MFSPKMGSPLLFTKVEPKMRDGADALLAAISEIAIADPSFEVTVDPESGEILLHGCSELHLDHKIDALIRERGIELVVGAPQVRYMETLVRTASVDYTHNKRVAQNWEFARLNLLVEPNTPENGNTFAIEFDEATAPANFIAGIKKGTQSVLMNGVRLGFPMTGISIRLGDMEWDDVSTPSAFELAARAALREASIQAEVQVLEPIMILDVTTLNKFAEVLVRDTSTRRGQVKSLDRGETGAKISALVPLASMFGYVGFLKRLTSGQASHSMSYSHYAVLPSNTTIDGPDNFPPAVGLRA